MPLPAIVHWEGNHWIVLFDVDETHVRVADPAMGLRKIPRREFETNWTGYAALFDYTTAFEQAPESKPALTWFLPFLARFKVILFQVLGLAVAVSILQLLFPVFTQMVVDKVIVENDIGLLKTILLGMLGALVFVQLSTLAQQYLLSFAAVRLDTAVLDFLSRKLLSLPMSYFTSRRTGDIQRRLDGARQVRQFAVGQGIGAILAMIYLVGALSLMAIYSPFLMLAFLATTPLYVGLMIFSFKVLRPLFAGVEESQGKYSSHQIDAIKGIEAVKAASAESSFRDAMLNEFLSVSKKMFKASFIVMSYDSILQSIGMLSTAIFLWVGATQVINGSLSVGGFVAFSSLTAMAYGGILRTLGVWDSMQFASVLLNRLNDIFEQEPEQGHDRSRLIPVHSLEGRIELRNVSFKYGGPEAPNILSDITLDLAPGRMVAFVGRSGCGKTTLIKLIAGLLEPTDGTIFFDNVDLKNLNYRDVRRNIGMVLQENHMFNETIARNIAFGDPEPDRRSRSRRGAGRCRARFRHAPSTRIRNQDRRVRPVAFRRTKAAHRHRPRHLQQPARVDFRRSDQRPGHGIGARDSGKSWAFNGGANDDCHRASIEHDPGSARDRCPGKGKRRRGRQSRGTHGAARSLLLPLEPATRNLNTIQ